VVIKKFFVVIRHCKFVKMCQPVAEMGLVYQNHVVQPGCHNMLV